MYLDERSSLLLKEVLNDPDISSSRLEEKYRLSRRQVSYSFKKINDWLKENDLPLIKRSNNGKFIVSSTLIEFLINKPEESNTKYIPSEKERAQLILLMILSSEEELSLFHFTTALNVSKNTVLRDLKYIQEIVSDYHLEVVYTRLNGYDLKGNEWNIRRLLIDVLQQVLDMFNGQHFIQDLINIPDAYIKKLRQQLMEVENHLHLKFIDERIKLLPYIIAILLRRIKRGKCITNLYHIDYEELSDTKEYEATEFLISKDHDIPEAERLFITLQLLTSKIFTSEFLTDKEMTQLTKALDECLNLFEQKACVKLKNRDKLLKRLILHMKPAYYRIKYNLTTNYSIIEKVSNQYRTIQYILKESIKPLEDYIGCEIPEIEIMFLTIIIGGHLLNSGETVSIKKKAVVVCPNGVSISELMEQTLKDLFPEFHFYDALSIREFQSLDMDVDIVFSPVPLQTDKKLFIVDQFMTDYEKVQLRQRVMKEIYGWNSSIINVEQIIGIVKKYARIVDQEALMRALKDYVSLSMPSVTVKDKKQSYQLSDLITPSYITIRNQVKSWHEAIQIASEPLLRKGIITQHYVEAMKRQFKTISPYIVLRMNIAIPHANSEDGVNDIGMSLLKINEGLYLDNNHKLHLVVVIAAIDKKTHLNALTQLMELASSTEDTQKIVNMNDPNEIFQVIEAYSK